MKLAIISVIVLYALVEASSGQVVVGTLITGKGNPVECMTEDLGPKCSTCTTLTLCNGDIPLTTITCSSPQPYCDPTVNMCTSVKPAYCPSSTFVCPMVILAIRLLHKMYLNSTLDVIHRKDTSQTQRTVTLTSIVRQKKHSTNTSVQRTMSLTSVLKAASR